MTRWEYKLLSWTGRNDFREDNQGVKTKGDAFHRAQELGLEGWELVGLTTDVIQYWFFKRPLPD